MDKNKYTLVRLDKVLAILSQHELPDSLDGMCDQNVELRLIAEEIEALAEGNK